MYDQKTDTLYKVKYSSENITPFGGLNFINLAITQQRLPDFINKTLGSRNYRAKYKYSDIALSLLQNALCNGEFVSDLKHLKANIAQDLKDFIPSHDTIEYALQELKVENKIITTKNGVIHQINRNDKLNELLVGSCVHLNLLKSTVEDYVLDFDHVVLENQKQDSKKSYKMKRAYHPCFANIGNQTVYLENRNGNTPAKYQQKESLKACFNALDKNKISIKSFRGDSASYQKDVIEFLMTKTEYFYIRNTNSQSFREACCMAENWEKIELNFEQIEAASVMFSPFEGNKAYRVVVTRTKLDKEQEGLFEEYRYRYYGIITNDMKKSNLEIIEFYNQRGDASENNHKNLLNDFNIHRIPFMDLDTNTVYMGLMALCSNIFEWIKDVLVKNKVEGIEQKHRTKRVFMKYICVCSKFVRHARKTSLVIFSKKKYCPLNC